VCRPEMTWLGGPPERNEGGEGLRMVGPLCARGEIPSKTIILAITKLKDDLTTRAG
jgi:hypothetical protein